MQRTLAVNGDEIATSSTQIQSSRQPKSSTVPGFDRSQLAVILEEDGQSASESSTRTVAMATTQQHKQRPVKDEVNTIANSSSL